MAGCAEWVRRWLDLPRYRFENEEKIKIKNLLVEPRGIEPLTSAVRLQRSPI